MYAPPRVQGIHSALTRSRWGEQTRQTVGVGYSCVVFAWMTWLRSILWMRHTTLHGYSCLDCDLYLAAHTPTEAPTPTLARTYVRGF